MVILLAPLTTMAQANLERLRRHTVSGIDYVAVTSWAAAYDLKLVKKPGDDVLRLTNRWARLQLKLDSRKAEINGIVVFLSNAVISQGGIAWISALDLRTVLHPILFPPRHKPPLRLRTVALDPGHGGKDPGNQEGSQLEKDFTLLLAKEIRTRLNRYGLKVVLTRDSDRFVALEQRPLIAAEKKADIMLSLHFNATGQPANGLKGIEVYCLTPAGARSTGGHGEGIPTNRCPGNRQDGANALLAYQVHKSLVTSLGAEDLGLRRARWMVLRNATMPAILIEGGYMSDPKEAQKIYSPTYRKQLAQAIIDGLLAYKRLVER